MFQTEISVWFVEPFLKHHFQAFARRTDLSNSVVVNMIPQWNLLVLNFFYDSLPKPFAQVNGKQLKKLVET